MPNRGGPIAGYLAGTHPPWLGPDPDRSLELAAVAIFVAPAPLTLVIPATVDVRRIMVRPCCPRWAAGGEAPTPGFDRRPEAPSTSDSASEGALFRYGAEIVGR